MVLGTSGTHTHNCGDQWKPRIHSSVSTHGCRGAHTCCGQVPPGCTQTLQVSLQQTSLPRHSTSPHGTTPAGHSRRQLCGQIWPGAQVAHTVRQPLCAAICERRVPATAPPPSSGEPHPMSCAANTINPADTNARRFKIGTPSDCQLFPIVYYRTRPKGNKIRLTPGRRPPAVRCRRIDAPSRCLYAPSVDWSG